MLQRSGGVKTQAETATGTVRHAGNDSGAAAQFQSRLLIRMESVRQMAEP